MATHQRDQLTVTNPTEKPFTVRWAGNPYVVNPGQQIIWPRFLAEHFAKRLADSILMRREQQHKIDYKKSGRPLSEYIAPALLNSRVERPKTIKTILLGVYSYYTPQGGSGGRAAEIQRQIDDWNQQPTNQPQQPQTQSREANMGSAADPLLGELADDDDDAGEEETETPPAAPAAPAGPQTMSDVVNGAAPGVPDAQPVQTTAPVPTAPVQAVAPPENPLAKRNRLVKEAKVLGIKVNPGMTSDALEEAIKKQYA